MYKGVRINIVDTPGHADFGGQVERVLGTVDGVLLVVDAFEGPMAQTRFVTSKALAMGLSIMVVVNKIDRDGCQPHVALDKVFDLFCELNATPEQLDFKHIFASGRKGTCRREMTDPDSNLIPMLDMVLEAIPVPLGDQNAPALLQIASLDFSGFLGRLAVGRVKQGTFKPGMNLSQSKKEGGFKNARIQKILRYEGIVPGPVDEATPGDIILIAGLESFDIGDTLCATTNQVDLPRIHIDPPTISMTFTVNTSPLAGKGGGKFLTGTHLQDRLERAAMADPALHVEKGDGASAYIVSGRGVLHLTILIENMRRELYEFTIGAPQVIYKRDEHGKLLEPMETFKVEVPQEFSGSVIEELGRRKGEMRDMVQDNNRVNLEYLMPSRGLIGIRSILLSLTKGYAVTQSLFYGYEAYKGDIPARVNGVLIAKDPGETTGYALWKLEERGYMIVPPGVEVYPGMIIGEHNRNVDIIVAVAKAKHLTNMRASGSDENMTLTPHRRLSLEESVAFINDDECVEVTPNALRIRKAELDEHKRRVAARITEE